MGSLEEQQSLENNVGAAGGRGYTLRPHNNDLEPPRSLIGKPFAGTELTAAALSPIEEFVCRALYKCILVENTYKPLKVTCAAKDSMVRSRRMSINHAMDGMTEQYKHEVSREALDLCRCLKRHQLSQE